MTATTISVNLLDEFRSPSLSLPLLQSLLHRLLSHPKIHNGFVDVLKLPSVRATLQKLDGDKRSSLVRTVELFAFGTVKEYYALKERGEVWALNDAQLEKLRMLTVASVAQGRIEKFHSGEDGGDVEMADGAEKRRTLTPKTKKKRGKTKKKYGALSVPYSALASELYPPSPSDGDAPRDEMSDVRRLEDLLIQCIYSNVVSAKLDQSSQSLRIEPHVALERDGGGACGSVLPRDLNTLTPESTGVEVSRMISSLEAFLQRSDALLATLERSSKATFADRKEDEMRWGEVQKAIDECPSRLQAAAAGGGGGMGQGMGMGMGGGGGDPMEVVDMTGRRQVKRSKGGHSMMMGGGGGVRFG